MAESRCIFASNITTMTTRETIIRFHLIINRLRKAPANFREILHFLEEQSELHSYDFTISTRTFKRDCEDIASIYGIEIVFDFSQKVYKIECEENDESKTRIMEAFDMIDTFGITKKISQHVYFEERRPQGTENLYGLLHAIKNRVQISFLYHKFWDDKHSERCVEPYALKEFKNRWYVLARDMKDHSVKTFALDRLRDLEISSQRILHPQNFDIEAYFKHSFGIINDTSDSPERVVLSFTPHQGKYIKTLPLHKSQKTLLDDEQEFRIELHVHPSYDLKMEILSMGANVRVIEPVGFRESVVKTLKDTLMNY